MLTYGFYNSVGKDRRYDAEQIGAMFDGLITDGIFANYKSALNVTPGRGFRELVINPGKAWFNGTWTTVDDGCHHIHLLGSAVETTYFIYLTVNKADRVNTIAGYTYERLSDPSKNIYSYLLAQVTIPGGVDEIQQSMIVDTRGSDLCPYVTGILETVSFEQIVREVCGDNWQMWLDEYSEALNLTVSEAAEAANTALAVARRTAADVTESSNRVYTWAQYSAVPIGAASYDFESATDEITRDAPPMRKLFWAPTFDGSTVTLVNPMQKTAVSAKVQLENWKRYKYFYGDGLDGTTDNTVYRYDELSIVYDGSTSNPVGVYTIKTSKAVIDPAPVVRGDFIGIVVADSSSAYPKNGPSGEYWYVRFSARADDVFFDDSEVQLSAQTVQEAIEALSKTGGSGSTGEGSMTSYVASDEPPEDTKALWVNTSEPGEAVALGVTAVETAEGVDLYCTDELGTTKVRLRHGKDGEDSGENAYELPIGGDELGGVKNGGNVVINDDGTMTAPEGGSSYTLPVANSTTLGGVKAQPKTAAMTQPVGVDEKGNLYTLPPAQNTTNVDSVSFTHHAGNLFDGKEYRGAMPAVGDDIFSPAGTSSYKYIVFRAKPNTEYFVTTASDFNPEGVGQADGAGRCTTEIVSFESADSVVSYVEWKKRTGGLGYYVHFKTNEKFREDTAYLIYKIVNAVNISDLLVFEGTNIEEYANVAEYSHMNGTDTSDTMLVQEKNLTKGINDKLNQAVSAVQPKHLKPTAYPWTTILPKAHYSFPVLNASAIGDFAKLCNSARICAADYNHLKLNTTYAHCPTIKIIDGVVYVVAFQNASNSDHLNGATIELFRANISEWTVIDQTNVASAGLACGAETLTDGCIDPNMLNIDNQTLRITFTTKFADGGHRQCYRDYDVATGTFGDIGLCKISDGVTVYDFGIPGIKAACGDFTAENPQIYMATQYATFNGEHYVAFAAGRSYKNAPILKTTDFITFTYWTTPVVDGADMEYECALITCRTAWGQDFLYSATRQYRDAFNEDSRRMLVSRIALTDGSVIRSVWVPDGNIRPFWHTRGETAYLWHTLETNRTCSTITSFPFNTNTLLPDSIGTAADTAAMIYATAEAYENDLIVCYMRKGGLYISRIPNVSQYDYGDVVPMLEKFLDFFGTK